MPTTILIATAQPEQLQAACAELYRPVEFYRWCHCDSPVTAERYLRQAPALVLLQVDAVLEIHPQWRVFARSCELSGIPTLVFSLNGKQGGQLQQEFPWCEGVVDPLAAPGSLLSFLQLHLDCQQLRQQLELEQGRLFEKNLELEEGLRSAANIQQTLMPTSFPDLPQLHFASCFIPCQTVGGDIFNVLRLDEQTVMVFMLDVSGHGVSAAMVTVSIFQALSLYTGQIVKRALDVPPYYQLTPPHEVLYQLDREYPFERFETFFTISYFLINPHSGKVRYASAAHPPALVVRQDGTLEHLDAEGTIIGLGGVVPYAEEQLTLDHGDRLFLYTDGIVEHEDGCGELFGQARLDRVLQQQRHRSLEQQCQGVIEQLQRFSGDRPFRDDVTLLALSFGF